MRYNFSKWQILYNILKFKMRERFVWWKL